MKVVASRGEPDPLPEAPMVSPILLPIAAPQLVVIPSPEPPPPPEPEPEPEPDLASTALALAPVIRDECVAETNPDGQPHCSWDTGFPAISADGSTIATAFVPDDRGRGNPGLTIRLVDVATSKIVKSVLVLSPDEYVATDDATRPALDKKISRRAAQAQALLGGYRAMTKLGVWDTEANQGRESAGLRAQFSDDSIRVIDTTTNVALWQRRFEVATEFPNRVLDGKRCEPTFTNGMSAAWDAPTRTLVTSVNYLVGPELCGSSVQRSYVVTVAP
ncbi:MAG: hypothetical protein JNL83_02885 [Myxococcales bacterium]|nr:hypothetical protein [Myxococcales bacterium]